MPLWKIAQYIVVAQALTDKFVSFFRRLWSRPIFTLKTMETDQESIPNPTKILSNLNIFADSRIPGMKLA